MTVIARSEKMSIPTYRLGAPEKNPVFFENRVYQGSTGKVYPVPFIDKVYDESVIKEYQAEILENEFVRIVLLPEIGGRIFTAQDRSNSNYDFFYKQDVIKPALVGLAGPWISGGVEFNWPQHHRPGTFLPTDVYLETETDGSKTLWMSEYDPMFRLKGMHGVRLHADSGLIELRVRLFNRTAITQTFLWWANMAVKVHEDYESFFPTDVHYVADHAVRAMSSFPFADNHYYGIPYHQREGKNDLRRYSHIPVPTSYMVCDTSYDFFGGYDRRAEGGFVHVANRNVVPGKKQWTWGNQPFGKAWDRELTDENGPYFELMAGAYTDNQPDFSYLHPYETKTFSQFWWSYQKLGPVQNANRDFALRVKIQAGHRLDLGVASSRVFEGLTFTLKVGEKEVNFGPITCTPSQPWQEKSITIIAGQENQISFLVLDQSGRLKLAYHTQGQEEKVRRSVAREPSAPRSVASSGELELIGEHLEQYRHPTRYPEPYLQEAINRDPFNHKAYTSLGCLALKQGKFEVAEQYFRKAIELSTSYHPNPADGTPLYFCGLACTYQDKIDVAYGLFYKATWNYAWRSAGYYRLASIDCLRSDYASALAHVEAALDTNRQNNNALIIKAIVKRKQLDAAEAKSVLQKLLKVDPLDQWARFELSSINGDYQEFLQLSRNDGQTVIDIAIDYMESGFYEEAIQIIEVHHEHPTPSSAVPNPSQRSVMTIFILAWLYAKIGDAERSRVCMGTAEKTSADYFFPSRVYEQLVLEWAMKHGKNKTVAAFGLGNYYYNLKRHEDAMRVWNEAAAGNCTYGSVHRNLGIAFWNVKRDGDGAVNAYAQALVHSPEDIRIHYEFDQLRKKLNVDPKDRLDRLQSLGDMVLQRDDFSVELATLLNFDGQYQAALALLNERHFHPWEGGEGQVLRQYTYATLRLGQLALEKGACSEALAFFNASLDTPDTLGEKYHPLQSVGHINYWKGRAHKALNAIEMAKECFLKSAGEGGDFVDMAVSQFSEITYYSALSLVELGQGEEAKALLEDMKSYARVNLESDPVIDYFATSLPHILVFDEDLAKRHQSDAKYLLALAELGLGDKDRSDQLAREVLDLNAMHIGAKDLIQQDPNKF